MRQDDDATANENTAHQDKFSPVKLDTSESPTVNMSLVTNGSEHCKSHAPYHTTKDEFTLNDSISVNNAATLVNCIKVKENYSAGESSIISTYDPLPDHTDNMQNEYNDFDKDVDQPSHDSRIVEKKTQIKSLPVLTIESTGENTKRENKVIAQCKVLCKPTTDRLDENMTSQCAPFVSRIDQVEFSHAGIIYTNTTKCLVLSVQDYQY